MLIPYKTLCKKYGIRPKGILHIGANEGQEVNDYLAMGVHDIILIEAIPEMAHRLAEKLQDIETIIVINACITDKDGENLKLNISSNNGESSSILEFGTHATAHPDVKYIDWVEVKTVRIDTLLKADECGRCFKGYDLSNYDFLNIDIQGAELMALKGMGDMLKKINYAYIEVNTDELYIGCPHLAEIDSYMNEFGFERKELSMTGWNWGDAFYIKK